MRILLNYPELLAAPLFNPATFGCVRPGVREKKEYKGRMTRIDQTKPNVF